MTTRCEIDPRANRKDDTEITTLASDFGYETNHVLCIYSSINSPCVARRNHSIRISAMKCVCCIRMKSTFPSSQERLVFIPLGKSSFSTIRWRNSYLKHPPRDESNVAHQYDAKVNFLSSLSSRFRGSLISLILRMILRKHIHEFRKFVVQKQEIKKEKRKEKENCRLCYFM